MTHLFLHLLLLDLLDRHLRNGHLLRLMSNDLHLLLMWLHLLLLLLQLLLKLLLLEMLRRCNTLQSEQRSSPEG